MADRSRELVAQASKLVLAGASDPKEDARLERARASFNSDELAAFMNDGQEKLQQRAHLAKVLAAQPWGDKSQRYFLTREQEYVQGLETSVGIWQVERHFACIQSCSSHPSLCPIKPNFYALFSLFAGR
jgi:hypothetical protein